MSDFANKKPGADGGNRVSCFGGFSARFGKLDCSADFVGADAAGANTDGFVLAAGQNHFAFLQVGVLEEPVVLVGEAHFVRLVAAFIAHFADCCHWGNPLFCFTKFKWTY